MNFQFLLEKLVSSEEFQKFKKENPGAYPFGGFFSFDLEKDGKENQYSLDYFIPEFNKAMSFKLEKGVEMLPITIQNEQKFSEIGANYSFDFEDFKELIENEMKKREMKDKIQKILYSLQNYEKEDYLLATVFLSGFGILQVNIKIHNKEILKFEKKGFMDFLKIVKK